MGVVATAVPFTAKGLIEAGIEGPIINYAPTADDAVLEAVNNDQFNVVRDFVTPNNDESTSAAEIRDAAADAGTDSADNMGAIAFTKGWVGCQLVAAGLKACGADCTGEGLRDAIDGLGEFDAGDLTSKPLTFSSTDHQGAEEARIVKWTDGKAEPVSDYFSVEFQAGK
jgi:hypothetical protein